MSDPLETLKAKKAKILADADREAAAVDHDMRLLEEAVAVANKYGLVLAQEPPHADIKPSNVLISKHVFPWTADGSAAYKAAICVAENVIKQAGVPLELSVLYDACLSLNVRLGGKRPQSTLSAYLSHASSSVESIRKGLYWLKGVPLPSKKSPTDTPTDGGYVNGERLPDEKPEDDWLLKAAAALAWKTDNAADKD
jgi:hypothetical protein